MIARLWSRDLPRAARSLRRRPAFSLSVILTLALALGANTVIFSFANALLLKPLPLRDPQRLGWIFSVDPRTGVDRSANSRPDFAAWRQEVHSFESLSGRFERTLTLSGLPAGALRVQANLVLGDLQGVWGLRCPLGRCLNLADERPGAPRVVVLSHRFWQRALGGRAGIVGESLSFNGVPHQVVGVAAAEIEIGNLADIEVWVPSQDDPALAGAEPHDLKITGRLRPGATIEQANAEVETVATRLAAEHAQTHQGWRARAVTTKEALGGPSLWFTLTMLLTVVALLLALACANVTNLLLACLVERRREFAVRAALGAPRRRIVGELLAEGLLLGALGGALGTLLAGAVLRFIRAVAVEHVFELFTIDWQVVGFAALLSFVAPLLFVLPAALRVVGREPARALNEGGRGMAGSGRSRGRSVLVAVQVAIAMTLLIVAGLVLRSTMAAFQTPLGFDPAPVLTMQLELGDWKYPQTTDVAAAEHRLLARLGAVAGVDTVALASELPVVENARTVRFERPGKDTGRPQDAPWATLTEASSEYFGALGLPVLAGRGFAVQDRAGAPRVAVVSRTAAERYWGSPAGALGARLTIAEAAGSSGESAIVVGVVADTANSDVMRPTDPRLYVAAEQQPPRAFSVLLRGAHPEAMADAARRAIADVDPDLAVYQLRTLREAIAAGENSDRLITGLFVAFAGLALLLASVGLYGVLAYFAAQRRRELAVRLACGAAPPDLRRLLFGQGLRLALVGSLAGLGLGLLLARLMAAKLFGITSTDAVTFGGATCTILACTLLAALRPALAAQRVDPSEALRGD